MQKKIRKLNTNYDKDKVGFGSGRQQIERFSKSENEAKTKVENWEESEEAKRDTGTERETQDHRKQRMAASWRRTQA